MKYVFYVLLLFSFPSFAQEKIDWQPKEPNPLKLPVDEQGEIQYREVIAVPTQSSGKVLKRVKSWIAQTYPSANDMIQEFDTTQGILVLKGFVKMKQGATLLHRLVVETKEGRCRATINQLNFFYETTTPFLIKKEIPVHAYGIKADDYMDMYMALTSGNSALAMGVGAYKRMARKTADNQEPMLAEVREKMESLMAGLKKGIATNSDW